MSHRDLIQEWFGRLWNDRDATALELRLDTASSGGLATQPLTSTAAFGDLYRRLMALLERTSATVYESVESATQVAARVQLRGWFDGREVVLDGAVFCEIREGKVYGTQNVWNTAAASAALGLPPAANVVALVDMLERAKTEATS